jgi:hypothetical protein
MATCEPLPRRNAYGSYVYRGVVIYRDGASRRYVVAYGRTPAGVLSTRTLASLRAACVFIDRAYLAGIVNT